MKYLPLIVILSTSCITSQTKKRAKARTDLGTAYLKEGKTADAVRMLRESISLNPRNANSWEKLALAYAAQNSIELADKAFQKSLRIGQRAETHNNYGLMLVSLGKYDDAIKHFKLAIGDLTYRNAALTLSNMGKTYHIQKKNKLALEALNQSVHRAPNLCQARFNRGMLFADMNKNQKALNDFQEVIELCGDKAIGAYYQAAKLLFLNNDHPAGCAYLQTIIDEASNSPLGAQASGKLKEECS